MRLKLRALAVLAAHLPLLFLALGAPLPCAYASGEYGARLGSYQGVVARSNGDWSGKVQGRYQCVEYARRFYQKHFNVTIGPIGVAQNLYRKAADFGLYVLRNGGRSKPRPNDILVFRHANGIGHMAVVTKVAEVTRTRGEVHIIEQNWSPISCTNYDIPLSLSIGDGTYRIRNRGRYQVLGWVRPSRIEILEESVRPACARPGEVLHMLLTISNPKPDPVPKVRLASSIRSSDRTGMPIHDWLHDKVLTLRPGEHEYDRAFRIPGYVRKGSYDVRYFMFNDDNNRPVCRKESPAGLRITSANASGPSRGSRPLR